MNKAVATLVSCAVLLAMLAGCAQLGPEQAASRPDRQRIIVNALKEKSTPPARISSSVVSASEVQRARGQLAFVAKTPAADARTWKPRRFFGPWFSGSDLEEIQVVLDGAVAVPLAAWYYAGFFASVQRDEPGDLRIFSQYVSNRATRTETPPALLPTPGGAPSGTPLPRVNKLRFFLGEILATSRYGGSIELRFQSSNDFEYQISDGSTLWDIRNLAMSIFVVPVPQQMNPAAPETRDNLFRDLKIEFQPAGVTAYDVASGNAKADNDLASLTAILQTLADSIEAAGGTLQLRNFKRDASQFAHAFIHTQQNELIDDQSPPERVDAIELADQHMVLHTRRPEVLFRWSVRLLYTSSSAELPMLFQVGSAHDLGGSPVDGPIYAPLLMPFSQTSWLSLGTFRLAECTSVRQVMAFVSVRDGDSSRDPLLRQQFTPEAFVSATPQDATTLRADLVVDCAAVNNFVQAFAPPIPGGQASDRVLFRIQEQEVLLIRPNNEVRGNYLLFVALDLLYR